MTKEFDAKNAEKSRRVCEDMEAAHVTKRLKLTERERRILAMWPRYEDGEPVMLGDEAINNKNQRFTVKRIEFRHGKWMLNDSVTEGHYLNGKSGERVERPARSVLDADGVEIKVGDTVWHHSGFAHGVVTSIDAGSLMGTVRYVNGGVEFRDAAKDLTHTRPDSWELLEENAADLDDMPCDFNAKDLIRRAKALAKVEEE